MPTYDWLHHWTEGYCASPEEAAAFLAWLSARPDSMRQDETLIVRAAD